MSYFNDCMDVLETLASTNLNNQIKAACTGAGIVWNGGDNVVFAPGSPNYTNGDYEAVDLCFKQIRLSLVWRFTSMASPIRTRLCL